MVPYFISLSIYVRARILFTCRLVVDHILNLFSMFISCSIFEIFPFFSQFFADFSNFLFLFRILGRFIWYVVIATDLFSHVDEYTAKKILSIECNASNNESNTGKRKKTHIVTIRKRNEEWISMSFEKFLVYFGRKNTKNDGDLQSRN